MKYVDEFRDAELGRAVAGEILATVESGRHYKVMEVCGGHTHSIYKYGVDDLLPENVELVHGPGLPGVRDPDGPRRRRHRDRAPAGRDLHVLRRHDARAGLRRHADGREGRGRGRAHGVLAARRAAPGEGEPRPRGRVLRDRLRDDRAVDRAHDEARQGGGRAELLVRVQPRHDRPAAARAARVAGPAARRLHRPGTRLHGRRRAPLPVHPRGLRPAGGRRRLRAARHPAGDPHDPGPARAKGAARWRTSTSASCPGRAT